MQTHIYMYTHIRIIYTDYIGTLMHTNTCASTKTHICHITSICTSKYTPREADLNELHFWAVLPSGFSQQEAPSEN